jgi:hypothetical protein
MGWPDIAATLGARAGTVPRPLGTAPSLFGGRGSYKVVLSESSNTCSTGSASVCDVGWLGLVVQAVSAQSTLARGRCAIMCRAGSRRT